MLWYEDEIKRLESERTLRTYEPKLAFYGSSSIRLWNTLDLEFEGYAPVNLGFGGSTLAACGWFFNRVFKSVKPESIIMYAGDNDLGDGRHAEEVFLFFKQIAAMVHERYGDIPFGFVSIKPSFTRWDILDKIRYTNKLVKEEISRMGGNACFINIHDKMMDRSGYPNREYLDPDGLHINEKGYVLWKETIMEYVKAGSLKLSNNPAIQPNSIEAK